MLSLFTFGLFIAVLMALIVWAPDLWRWLAPRFGFRAPARER